VISAARNRALQVHIQGALPDIRGQFEELGMELVINRITPNMRPLPSRMAPLGSTASGDLTAAQRMLDAHKALASLGEHNRDEFIHLIEALQGEVEQMQQTETQPADPDAPV